MTSRDLERIDWGEVLQRLTERAERRLRFAVARGETGTGHILGKSGEDFASEVVVAVLSGTREIDPDQPLLDELFDLLRSAISSALRRRENATGSNAEPPEVPVAPDFVVYYRDIDDRLREFEDLRPVFRLCAEGYERPRDFAKRLNISEEEFVNRRKRLRRLLIDWGYGPEGAVRA